MSTVVTYNYNCSFNFSMSIQAPVNARQTRASLEAALQSTMPSVAAQKFADGFAGVEGHWFRVNSTTVTLTSFSETPPIPRIPIYTYLIVGTCITNVDTDIADAKKELSPQNWWLIFLGVVATICLALVGLPTLATLLLVVVVCAATYESLTNTTTGAITTIGHDLGSMILVMGILAVSALGIYALFFTKTGQKAASKGYEMGRRGYRAVRGRLK